MSNRAYGTARAGTRAHMMATVGWAGFGECPTCGAVKGEPCVSHSTLTKRNIGIRLSEPHAKRKMVTGIAFLSNGKRDIGLAGLAQVLTKIDDAQHVSKKRRNV